MKNARSMQNFKIDNEYAIEEKILYEDLLHGLIIGMQVESGRSYKIRTNEITLGKAWQIHIINCELHCQRQSRILLLLE